MRENKVMGAGRGRVDPSTHLLTENEPFQNFLAPKERSFKHPLFELDLRAPADI